MTEDNNDKKIVTDPTEPVNFNRETPSIENELNTDVLNRLRTLIQEEDNPIARLKLKEWRDQINSLISQLEEVKTQKELSEEGLKHDNTVNKASIVNILESEYNKTEQLFKNRMSTLDKILDYAESKPDENLQKYIEAIEQREMEQQMMRNTNNRGYPEQ